MERLKRIGLLGGTFDPPHMGHLWLAEAARDQLQLDQVLFLPVGDPVHKQDKVITAVSHRLQMVADAIADNPYFTLDTIDFERPSPHTTVSLLPLLQKRYLNSNFWFLIGSDSLRSMPSWTDPIQLVQLCRFAVLPRRGIAFNWSTLEQEIPDLRQRVDLIVGPTVDISATSIREWVRSGRSLRYLVPDSVRDYIVSQGLYQTKNPTPQRVSSG